MYLDFFITFIFTVKIVFILLSVYQAYLKMKKEKNTSVYKKIHYWRERFEFIFVICMGILLIYLFRPSNTNPQISGETKILLYLYGVVSILIANWKIFIREAPWFQELQYFLQLGVNYHKI